MRPEVVEFLRLDTLLSEAQKDREDATRAYVEIEHRFRDAWGRLTITEREEINDACRSSEAPTS